MVWWRIWMKRLRPSCEIFGGKRLEPPRLCLSPLRVLKALDETPKSHMSHMFEAISSINPVITIKSEKKREAVVFPNHWSYITARRSRQSSWAESSLHGCQASRLPKLPRFQSDVVFPIVGYPSDVRHVILDPNSGALSGLSPGGILVDMTTSDPSLAAEEISKAASFVNCFSIDAPVSGGDLDA
ncbi:unnamed protein product [Eruca vesicaria subsp. sativa]|uniref:6-phosphogluconate dehydrogenase NADP-binding domain-containing protein n=1 Tax=Eruca vesicaria subsp. sativa TaxID=29727 RepID=A0ABC8IV49_ERUVS|nr:unnamed protein product [Eruca vesicaria subsp. sativa]